MKIIISDPGDEQLGTSINHNMTTKELIEKLKELPQDLPIRTINPNVDDDIPNQWVYDIEISNTGQSGYEVSGEIRLLTSE